MRHSSGVNGESVVVPVACGLFLLFHAAASSALEHHGSGCANVVCSRVQSRFERGERERQHNSPTCNPVNGRVDLWMTECKEVECG